MVRRIVSEWLAPFGRPRFKKPDQWADNLRPDPTKLPAVLQEEVRAAQEALLKMQNFEDGYWCAKLRADTTIDSDTIMLFNFLGRGDSPKAPKLARFILSKQLPDGGWPIYENGPADLSATVKAY